MMEKSIDQIDVSGIVAQMDTEDEYVPPSSKQVERRIKRQRVHARRAQSQIFSALHLADEALSARPGKPRGDKAHAALAKAARAVHLAENAAMIANHPERLYAIEKQAAKIDRCFRGNARM